MFLLEIKAGFLFFSFYRGFFQRYLLPPTPPYLNPFIFFFFFFLPRTNHPIIVYLFSFFFFRRRSNSIGEISSTGSQFFITRILLYGRRKKIHGYGFYRSFDSPSSKKIYVEKKSNQILRIIRILRTTLVFDIFSNTIFTNCYSFLVFCFLHSILCLSTILLLDKKKMNDETKTLSG